MAAMLGGEGDRRSAGGFGIEAAVLLLAFGGFFGVRLYRFGRAAYQRLTAKTAHARSVADAREGELCALEGTVHRMEELLTSPCGTLCVAYLVEVQRRDVTHENTEVWFAHAREERGVDFLLEDGSGRARVLGAKASFPEPPRWQHTRPAGVLDLVARLGQSTADDYRWRECTVEPGARVRITGVARWDDAGAGDAGYRGGGRRQLVIDAPDDGWIGISRGA
jgi:hypothetical protein